MFISYSVQTVHALEFGVFSDVIFSSSDAPNENTAFSLGALDFFATTNINEDTRIFIEYVFESNSDGLVTDLERLWIMRTFSEEFKVAVGRFHTPLGKWNRTYHHGAILQDTIARPFFLDFEDGRAAILPVHIVGLLSNGNFIMEQGELGYEIYVANGPSLNTSIAGLFPTNDNRPKIEMNTESDPNSDKTYGFRLTYSLDSVPLSGGLVLMSNSIADSSTSGGLAPQPGDDIIAQTITGVDASYDNNSFNILFEYYQLNNKAKIDNLESHTSNAYYAQFGYKISQSNKLIYRYASLNFNENDLYYRLLGTSEETHHIFTFRHDIDETNTIKIEYNKHLPELTNINNNTILAIQWSFLVP